MANLALDWTKHLTDATEKEKFTAAVRGDVLVLSRLQTIIRNKMEALDRLEETDAFHESGYDSRQPFVNGQRRALRDISRLFDFMDKK